MPKGLTAATGMDALTHAIESYITPGAWAMSDMFELKAIEMIAQNLKAAVDNGKDTVAREAMSQAQYIAGMGFSNVGLGIVHSMAHPLGAFYDTPHGVANALLLPYVMEYNAESPAAPKYINIAKAMGVNTDGMTEAYQSRYSCIRRCYSVFQHRYFTFGKFVMYRTHLECFHVNNRFYRYLN